MIIRAIESTWHPTTYTQIHENNRYIQENSTNDQVSFVRVINVQITNLGSKAKI